MKEVTARGKKACLPNLSSFNTSTVSGSEEEKRQNPNFSLTFDLQSIYQQIEKVFYNKLLKCAGCGAEGKHIHGQGYCYRNACVEKRDRTIGSKAQRITCLACDKGGRLVSGYCNRTRKCFEERYLDKAGNPPGKCSLCGSTAPLSRGHCSNRICARNYTHSLELKKETNDSDMSEIEGDFSEEMPRSKVAKND